MRVATEFQKNDRIALTIAATTAGRKPLAVAETLDGEGYLLNGLGERVGNAPALDLSGIIVGKQDAAPKDQKPEFDIEGYIAAVRTHGVNSAEAQGFQQKHNIATAEWALRNPQQAAQQNTVDKVVAAVLDYAAKKHGFSLAPSVEYWVDPAKVIVNAPVRNNDGDGVMFAVTIAPVWGGR